MHEEHAELRRWAGRRYDPEKFDLAAANRALRKLRKRPSLGHHPAAFRKGDLGADEAATGEHNGAVSAAIGHSSPVVTKRYYGSNFRKVRLGDPNERGVVSIKVPDVVPF
jgi:hypothetical protein